MRDHSLRRLAGSVVLAGLLLCNPGINGALAQAAESLRVSSDASARQLINRAEDLLAAGNSPGAYELLQPHEAALAGDVLYDYLLGVAALDTGRLSEAIFSLRRALAVEPAFSGARMELARAYFESGNPDIARPLFAELLNENPPAAVDSVIRQYLQAIDQRAAARQSRFIPYADLYAGYDTNANGSTDNQEFLGFTLSPRNIATESGVVELGAGFDWFVPKNSRFGWIVNGRALHRANFDASFVDATVVNGLGGFNWQRNAWFGRAAVDGYWATRDGDPNESYAGVGALIGRRLADRWDMTLDLRGGAQRYDDSIEVLDVNRFLYSLGLTHRFVSLAQFNIQLMGGSDDETNDGSPYGNSKIGARMSLTAPMGNAAWMYASLGSLTSDYDGLFFGSAREDRQLTSILQVEFRDVLTPGLSIIPRIRYVNNDSDVDLYSYDRTEMGVVIRWMP